jgi:YD repeat-containing protein
MSPVNSASNLTFDDEFNGLNLQREGQPNGWATAYAWDSYDTLSGHTITGESEVYVDPTFAGSNSTALGLDPFSINDGVLSITAAPAPAAAQGALWDHNYTSGLLTTAGSFAQTYGYFEMRAELPAGQGAFPAFWLLSADGKYNEIDVMETVNGSDEVWNHLHYTPDGASEQAGVGFSSTVPNLSAGFHTFGLLWDPQTITWYVDGAAVASTPTPAVLNSPMYMLANYAVGGSWAGAPDGSPLSAMQIDYIRAYSLDDAPVGDAALAKGHDGTSADETITAVSGGDTIRGFEGDDTIQGGPGDDLVHGGAGADLLYGGQGNDTIFGDQGHDLISGNRGADLIYGSSDDSVLYGGKGGDTIHAGAGNDQLSGDLGDDVLYGGGGADRFLFKPGDGHDSIGDFDAGAGDKIVLSAGTGFTLTTDGSQAVIDYGAGDQITLTGVSLDQLPSQTGDWIVYG